MKLPGRAFRSGVLLAVGCGAVLGAAASSVHDADAQYRFACAQCHGLAGTAKSPSGLDLPGRVLADRTWMAKQEDPQLLRSILDGKGAMPSFKHKMTAEEAKRLLTEVVRPMARKTR